MRERKPEDEERTVLKSNAAIRKWRLQEEEQLL